MKLCSGCLHSGERQYENLCLDAIGVLGAGCGIPSPKAGMVRELGPGSYKGLSVWECG